MGGIIATSSSSIDSSEPLKDVLFINNKLKGTEKGFGFSRSMFSKMEWRTLKKYCQDNNIRQIDLNRVYNIYLASDAALIRNMRVLLTDITEKFSNQCSTFRDLSEIFIPGIFLRTADGLKNPHSDKEVSFARFVLCGCIFCNQPVCDIVYDFFSICRQNLEIKPSATIFSYNFKQVVIRIGAEMPPSAVWRYIEEKCIVENEEEISISALMQMSLKYPLLFYAFVLFQRHFKRVFFGDEFWNGRNQIASRFQAHENLTCSQQDFENISNALQQTARVILADYFQPTFTISRLHPEKVEVPSMLNEQCCVKLKNDLGYKWARDLISESAMDIPKEQTFAEIPQTFVEEMRLYDSKIDSEFVYNAGSGYRAWVERHKLSNGKIVKEWFHRTSPDL
jgi:hypothetical protein